MSNFLNIQCLLMNLDKVCTSSIQQYVEEEELGDNDDTHSVDMMGSGHGGHWFKGHRHSQVAPEGTFSVFTILSVSYYGFQVEFDQFLCQILQYLNGNECLQWYGRSIGLEQP